MSDHLTVPCMLQLELGPISSSRNPLTLALHCMVQVIPIARLLKMMVQHRIGFTSLINELDDTNASVQ